MEDTLDERAFSIELKSKANLKNVTLSNGGQENVLVEGTIGKLQQAEFADDRILVVTGDRGILRISLTQNEIKGKQIREKEA